MENVIDPKGKVADLHTSLRMKEFGFTLDTEKYWYQNDFNQIKVMTKLEAHYDNLGNETLATRMVYEKVCPAPDFDEIWKELPNKYRNIITNDYSKIGELHIFDHSTWEDGVCVTVDCYPVFYQINGNLAQAAAELWCKLKTEKII